jgi:hypothetical protein
VPAFDPEALASELAGDLGLEGFGLGLRAEAREVRVEVGAEDAARAALEGAGGMEGRETGVVLGQALVRLVPGLADVEVIFVTVELDDIDAIAAGFGDVLGAGDEVEAKFEIVTVAGEVIVVDVIAVQPLGHELAGFWVEEVIDEERAKVASCSAQVGGKLGAPGVVSVRAAGDGLGRHIKCKCNRIGRVLPRPQRTVLVLGAGA